MKVLFKPLILVGFLFCIWQNANSQFLDPMDGKKGEYLPPYNPDIVLLGSEVEKWINEQLTDTSHKKNIEMKTDILGRFIGERDKARRKVKTANITQKRLVVISDMHINELKVEPMYARYEYNPNTKNYVHYLNGKKVNAKEYDSLMGKHYEKFYSQSRGKRNLPIPGVISSNDRSWTAWITTEEISTLIKNYKEIDINDYREPKYDASIASLLTATQLSTHAFPNGYKGDGIGIYVGEHGCREPSISLVNSSKFTNLCSGANHWHPSASINVIQYTAPLAHVFHTASAYPSNPFSYSPPIEIGTHSWSEASPPSAYAHLYNFNDRDMDNYIYENRVITFKSAGNKQGYHPIYDPTSCIPSVCDTTSHVTSPGKALNAITVGAVEPATMNYDWFSKWKNPDIGNAKPELAMYTNIDLGIHGPGFEYSQTSAATPLVAGFTASLLHQHPFFKRQPALVKALLVTGEDTPIPNANTWDQDNYMSAKGIVTYSSVAWGTRSAWWDGYNSSFFDSNEEILFTENNIQANKRYKIAIAWLAFGSYINLNKVPPQDINLYVIQDGHTLATSTSARSPYELADFVTRSNTPLTIIIKRLSNSGTDRVILGYHMRENF